MCPDVTFGSFAAKSLKSDNFENLKIVDFSLIFVLWHLPISTSRNPEGAAIVNHPLRLEVRSRLSYFPYIFYFVNFTISAAIRQGLFGSFENVNLISGFLSGFFTFLRKIVFVLILEVCMDFVENRGFEVLFKLRVILYF